MKTSAIIRLTVVVLTRNNEGIISRCLDSLQFADEILIIDDKSTDKTVEIGIKAGATVISHPLNNDWALQRNFALDKSHGQWILFIDSDETVSPQLAQEIKERISIGLADGYYLGRRDFFFGKLLKFGEVGSVRLLRLAKRNSGKWHRSVHEVWKIEGKTDVLKNSLIHFPHPTIAEFGNDINRYSELDAKELIKGGRKFNYFEVLAYPIAKFIRNYFFRLGFLDLFPGFVMAYMMSIHSLLVRVKTYELEKIK